MIAFYFQIFFKNGFDFILIEFVIVSRVNNLRIKSFCGDVKLFQSIRQNKIVAVDKVNVLAASVLNAGVARGTESEIFFVAHDFYLVIAAVKSLAKRNGIVGRGVVHQNNFKVLKRLIQNAVDALLNINLDIVNGHNHRNFRVSFHNITSENILSQKNFPRQFGRGFFLMRNA